MLIQLPRHALLRSTRPTSRSPFLRRPYSKRPIPIPGDDATVAGELLEWGKVLALGVGTGCYAYYIVWPILKVQFGGYVGASPALSKGTPKE